MRSRRRVPRPSPADTRNRRTAEGVSCHERRADHRTQARRRGPVGRRDPRTRRGLRRRHGSGLPDVGLGHGRVYARDDGRRDGRTDSNHACLGRNTRCRRRVASRRQTFDRRHRRQDLAHPRAAVGLLRATGPHDLGTRPGAHGRHARQVGVHTRIPHRPFQQRDRRRGGSRRLRHHRRHGRHRAGRPKAVRLARCDGHGGLHSADCRQHPQQEAG